MPQFPLSRSTAVWGALAAITLLALGGWFFSQRMEQRARLVAAIPTRPEPGNHHREFRFRLERAENRARSGGAASPNGIRTLALLYHANGFSDRAAQLYACLASLEPDNARWPYLQADTHIRFGTSERAIPLLQKTQELAPDYLPAQLRRADVLSKSGESEAAAEAFAEVLDADPANRFALLGLARLAMADKHLDIAEDRLLKATREHPRYGTAWALLATVHQIRGDDGAARSARERSQETPPMNQPDDPWLDLLRDYAYDSYQLRVAADAALLNDDPAKAAALLHRALRLQPEDGRSHLLLARVRLLQGDADSARQHLREAVRLDADTPAAWMTLVNLTIRQGDPLGLEQLFAEGITQAPDSAGLRFAYGLHLAHQEKLATAESHLQEAARLSPNEAIIQLVLAQILARRGKHEASASRLDRALELDPGNSEALTTRAHYAINEGDAERARNFIHQAGTQEKTRPSELDRLNERFLRRFGSTP